MDINTLRSLSTVLVAVAFAAICWWAFSPKRKKRFEEDAQLPFADEQSPKKLDESSGDSQKAAPGDEASSASFSEQKKGQDKP